MTSVAVLRAQVRFPTPPGGRPVVVWPARGYRRFGAVTIEPESQVDDDRDLVAGLRARDETAFVELVNRWTPTMLRVARRYVATPGAAEDVVQETWLGVLRGIDAFEQRSSLKTWVFRILSNRAKTRGVRDQRSVPFSSLVHEDVGDAPTVDPSRFRPAGHPRARHWNVADGHGPADWGESPEDRVLSGDGLRLLHAAIAALPDAQRTVMTLRDVEGFPAEEVCQLLELSPGNQRVILHRARAGVRAALEEGLAS
jgi:RNA polymerase sigma-70 factor (ECF subfamily)